MNQLTNKPATFTAHRTVRPAIAQVLINTLTSVLARLGLLRDDAEYHLLRASMVIIFFFFGYQKWFAYEVDRLIPFISHGPLIFWLYPLLGMRGATLFLGVLEWTFGVLLFLGFWNQTLGILGALHRDFHRYGDDHPIHAGRLGCSCRRVSGHDRQRPVPNEGCRAPGGVGLSAEAGRSAGSACQHHQRSA